MKASQVIASLSAAAPRTRRRPSACSRSRTASEANRSVLEQIAEASGGKGYTGDPTEIEGVYRQISSFF